MTAYERRISDVSSDVFCSDLGPETSEQQVHTELRRWRLVLAVITSCSPRLRGGGSEMNKPIRTGHPRPPSLSCPDLIRAPRGRGLCASPWVAGACPRARPEGRARQ